MMWSDDAVMWEAVGVVMQQQCSDYGGMVE